MHVVSQPLSDPLRAEVPKQGGAAIDILVLKLLRLVSVHAFVLACNFCEHHNSFGLSGIGFAIASIQNQLAALLVDSHGLPECAIHYDRAVETAVDVACVGKYLESVSLDRCCCFGGGGGGCSRDPHTLVRWIGVELGGVLGFQAYDDECVGASSVGWHLDKQVHCHSVCLEVTNVDQVACILQAQQTKPQQSLLMMLPSTVFLL